MNFPDHPSLQIPDTIIDIVKTIQYACSRVDVPKGSASVA